MTLVHDLSVNLSTQILCHLVVMTSVVCFFEIFKNHWVLVLWIFQNQRTSVQVGWNLFRIKELLVPVISKTLRNWQFSWETDKEPMVFWPVFWYPHNIFENCDYRLKPFLLIFGEPVGKWVYIRVNNQWTSFWKSPNTGYHRDGIIHWSRVFTQ